MNLNLFIPLTKIDEEKRMVYGILAEESVDKSGEIFDYGKSKPHFAAWSKSFREVTKGKSAGNLRRMHQNVVAGHLTEMVFNDAEKRIEVAAKVTDDSDWAKVKDGDYTGFSVGGRYVEKWDDVELKATRYVADPAEASLVDNPCMRGATFTAIKVGGAQELRKFNAPDPQPAAMTWTSSLLKSEIAAGRGDAVAALLNKRVDVDPPADPLVAAPDAPGDPQVVQDEVSSVSLNPNLSEASGGPQKADGGVSARDDVDPGEGTSQYGDVVFADEKNKKYPVDTAAHIRAAWNYINKEKNAAKYSAKDASTIKRKIISAWKRQIDKAGPPSAKKDDGAGGDMEMSAKVVEAFGLLKWQDGLYHVQTLAGILASLDMLLECVEREEFNEGDFSSPIPAVLRQCIQSLGDALVAMCQEETSELYGEEATLMAGATIEDLRKIVKDEQDKFGMALTSGFNASFEKVLADTMKPMIDAAVAKVDGAVKAVEKTAAGIDERLTKVEKQPASVGRPVAVAEKTTGGGDAQHTEEPAVTVDSLEKAVKMAEAMEGIDEGTRQKLRLALASAMIMTEKR